MKIIAILSMGLRGEVGCNNDLIWKIPEDLSFFKIMTTNQIVAMGYNTMKSLPKGFLPNRINYVLSNRRVKDAPKEVGVVKDVWTINRIHKEDNKDLFIIGGAKTYEDNIDACDEVFLTLINDKSFDADTFIPMSLFNVLDWKVNHEIENLATKDHPAYTIIHLIRRRKNR